MHDPSPACGRRWRDAPDEGRCASTGAATPLGSGLTSGLMLRTEMRDLSACGRRWPRPDRALAALTFYSYCAYSPSARPAWGPGRDGGLGWGSSGGPAGRGKRTPGSRERNARPRGHYDPRACRQLAGRHCRFRSALRSAKVPPAAGAVRALSTSHLLSPRWAAPAPPSRALERQPPRRRPEPPQERSPMSRRLKRLHPCRKPPAKPSFDLGPPSAYLSSRQLAG